MESLKRSCLRWTIGYVVVSLLLAALVYIRFPRLQVALGSGFAAAILVWFTVAYLFGIRARRAEGRLIRRGMREGRPEDGEKIAVVGTISSSFETVEAPITGRSCVAYEYKALAGDNQQYAAYEGFALVPLSIDGPRGSIRLLATPELAFDFDTPTRIEQYERLRDYISRTQFTFETGIDIKARFAHLKTVVADDDGRIRYDIRHDPAPDVDGLRLQEKILAPGEHIVAIGRYSAARNALVPDATQLMHPVKIRKGEPDKLARTTGRDLVDAMMGCGCLLPVVIAALIGLASVPLEAIEQMFPKKEASWTEIRVERWLQKTLRPKLAGILDEPAEYAIVLERGEARGKLSVGDTTVALTRASAVRDGDAVEVSLTGDDASSGVIARLREKRIESLRLLGGGTIDAAYANVETLAAYQDTMNGRLLLLSPGKGPRMRVMFRTAIVERSEP